MPNCHPGDDDVRFPKLAIFVYRNQLEELVRPGFRFIRVQDVMYNLPCKFSLSQDVCGADFGPRVIGVMIKNDTYF